MIGAQKKKKRKLNVIAKSSFLVGFQSPEPGVVGGGRNYLLKAERPFHSQWITSHRRTPAANPDHGDPQLLPPGAADCVGEGFSAVR